MRKFLYSLLAVVIIVILALPFLVGRLVASEFKAQVAAMHYKSVRVKLLSFHSGWFSSSARIEIDRRVPGVLKRLFKDKIPQRFVYRGTLKIAHGPVAMASNLKHHRELIWGRGVITGNLKLVAPQASVFSRFQGLNQVTRVFGVVGLNGVTHLTFAHPGLKYMNAEQGELVTLGKIVSHVTLGATSSPVKGSTRLASLTISSKTWQMATSPIRIDFQFTPKSGNQWAGKQVVTIQKILFGYAGKTRATLTDFQLKASNHLVDGFADLSQTITIGQLAGGSFHFDHFKIQIGVKHFNMAARAKLLQLIKNKQYQTLSKTERKQKTMHGLIDMLKGSAYQLKTLQVHSSVGLLQADGSLKFAKTMPSSDKIQDPVVRLAHASTAELNVSLPYLAPQHKATPLVTMPGPVVPKSNVSAAPQDAETVMLTTLIHTAYQKGYVVKHGDRLVAHMKYQLGKVYLNNQLLPLLLPPKNKPPVEHQVAPANLAQPTVPQDKQRAP